MAVDLIKNFPKDLLNDTLKKFLKALSVPFESLRQDIKNLTLLLDWDKLLNYPDFHWIFDELLKIEHWYIPVELTALQKRKLIPYVPWIMENKGHPETIIFIAKLLYNITFDITPTTDEVWLYGTSEYGSTTIIAPLEDGSKSIFKTVDIVSAAILQDLRTISKYLRPVTVEYQFGGVGVTTTLKNLDQWEYGSSLYGEIIY